MSIKRREDLKAARLLVSRYNTATPRERAAVQADPVKRQRLNAAQLLIAVADMNGRD